MKTRGYHAGDRLWYRNSFGQEFYARIVRILPDIGKLMVRRDEWPSNEIIDLDDYPVSRHFERDPVGCYS